MSDTYINQLTIDCFRNKPISKTISRKPLPIKINKKDKHFYRKRILGLTRELLQDSDYETFSDVKHSFDIYVKNCIDYFKTLDKSDILQEDYNEINENIVIDNTNCEMINEPEITKKINNLMMKSIKDNRYTLDGFITKTVKKIDEPFVPLQKEINLKDPNLRIKGIRQKKNIHNIYDEISDQKKNADDKTKPEV
jgi:hypothetical protein